MLVSSVRFASGTKLFGDKGLSCTPKVCRIIAFYRFWAIILPTFGGPGKGLCDVGPFRAGQSLNPNLKPGADGQLVFRVQCGEFPKIGDPRVPLKGSLKGSIRVL